MAIYGHSLSRSLLIEHKRGTIRLVASDVTSWREGDLWSNDESLFLGNVLTHLTAKFLIWNSSALTLDQPIVDFGDIMVIMNWAPNCMTEVGKSS